MNKSRLLAAVVLALAWLGGSAALAEGDSADAAPVVNGALIGVLEDGSPVYLRALDDPQNPYRGEYVEYDEWLYSNEANLPADQVKDYFTGRASYGGNPAVKVVIGRTDREGFLLPYARMLEAGPNTPHSYGELAAEACGLKAAAKSVTLVNFYAAGEMPVELREQQKQISQDYQARNFPPIADWLLGLGPQGVIFVPNGDVLCCDDGRESTDPTWRRYDAGGKLLATFGPGHEPWRAEWTYIYWPEMNDVLDPLHGAAETLYFDHGLSIVATYDDPARVDKHGRLRPTGFNAIYDYDGTARQPDEVLSPLRLNQGQVISGETLAEMYSWQQELGPAQS